MSAPLIVRKGWLQVKGPHLKKFKKCWVKLNDSLLQVFSDEKEGEIVDTIPLNGGIKVAEVDKKEEKKMDNVFQVFYPLQAKNIPVRFCADTKQEYVDWMRDINRGIDVGSSNIFGIDLTIVVHKQSGRSQLPVVVEKTINYLSNHTQVPGIFRVSGTATDVNALKSMYDRGNDVDLSTCPDPHVVSNLLKLFLRELPNPLMTSAYYPKFIEAYSIPNINDQIDRIRALINCLPAPHLATLQHLLYFLSKVASFSSVNMMTTLNLATVFGPTILRPDDDVIPDATKMEVANILTDRIIQSYDKLFPTASPLSTPTPQSPMAKTPLAASFTPVTSAPSTPVTASPTVSSTSTTSTTSTAPTIPPRRVPSFAPGAAAPLVAPVPTPQTGTTLRKLPPSVKEAIETRDETSDENAKKLGQVMLKGAPVLKPAPNQVLKRTATSPSLPTTPNGSNTPATFSSTPSSPSPTNAPTPPFRAALKPVSARPLPSATPNSPAITTTNVNVNTTPSSTITPPPPSNTNSVSNSLPPKIDNGVPMSTPPPPPLDSSIPLSIDQTSVPPIPQFLPPSDISSLNAGLPPAISSSALPPPPLDINEETGTVEQQLPPPITQPVIQQNVPTAKPDTPSSSKAPASRPIPAPRPNANNNSNAKIEELESKIQSLESALERKNELLSRVLAALERANIQI
eukprot:TRINITY_DN6318_c0_g1_i4.p1 TRINITY_DN6318_c0_g1~~TRINITY_DN6318_c0_g1_i4.p1  ORF type:complete len:684 (-),score=159.47 TRINITY_DN6318_c0_g1_i4:54-2105(-)